MLNLLWINCHNLCAKFFFFFYRVEQMGDKDPKPPPKKKAKLARTNVHDEFIETKLVDPETKVVTKTAKCKVCSFKFNSWNSTNLKKHLDSFHPEVHARVTGIFK